QQFTCRRCTRCSRAFVHYTYRHTGLEGSTFNAESRMQRSLLDARQADWILFGSMNRICGLRNGKTASPRRTSSECEREAQVSSAAFLVVAALTMLAFNSPLTAQDVPTLTQNPAVKAALAAARTNEPQTIENQIRISEIPAPSFKEAARGEEMRRQFQ